MNTQNTIIDLKMSGCDHEFYPTTMEVIEALNQDIKETIRTANSSFYSLGYSFMDIGAGNGKVITELRRLGKLDNPEYGDKVQPTECYAIEKSPILLESLPKDIYVVGTDLFQSTLIDKKVKVAYTNPPYSMMAEWLNKAIREANAELLYFLVPKRWRENPLVNNAIKDRQAHFEIVGSFDFEDSEDRKARAYVDLVRVELKPVYRGKRAEHKHVDPFELWFDENFNQDEPTEEEKKAQAEQIKAEKKERKNELISKRGMIDALVYLHNEEMNHLLTNYQSINGLDSTLLAELGVTTQGIAESIKMKINGLKDKYWRELFDKLDKLTSRLTTASRTSMLDKLFSNTKVEFNQSNIHAILGWAVKNSNSYFDSQLVETYSSFIEQANIINYKSNQRIYSDNDWGYNRRCKPSDLSHFKLDYRLILSGKGGISESYDNVYGLAKSASTFLRDLITVANNLGFTAETPLELFAGREISSSPEKVEKLREIVESGSSLEWEPGKNKEFLFKSSKTGQEEVLMTVKAHKNGNIHVKLNQAFIATLNIEFGRLKGWIFDSQAAATEVDVPVKLAEDSFASNFNVLPNQAHKLLIAA